MRLPSLFALRLCLIACLAAPSAQAIGILVPTKRGLPQLDLVSHRVNAKVNERGATTKVTQVFENKSGRQLEATYLFPLPKDATVDEFALWMNGKRTTGKVLERKEARRTYESIVRRARDPGLIEYVDSQLFQARVFPVPAHGRIKVELIYSNLVDYYAGVHRYVYPMKTDANASRTLKDFTFTVEVKNKLPIKNVYSPTHHVATRKRGNTAVASFEKNAFSLNDDFTFFWSVDDKDVGLTVMTYKEGDEPGYFLALASPKDDFRDKEIIGKRVSFVVDTSGSMLGEKMDATKKALDYCLRKLGGDDLFNVITFGGYVETFQDKMVAASSSNVRKARAFVKAIDPMGGTNIDDALKTTFQSASGSKKTPHMVVFLTDGRPTVGETDVRAILSDVSKAKGKAARLFVLGVGEDVNTNLLDRLALDNGGSAHFLRGDQTLESDIALFYDRISHPVLSDLVLNTGDVRVFGTHPRKLPDLFKGAQLVVLGRYRHGGRARVNLTGTTPKGRRTFSYTADFARGSEGTKGQETAQKMRQNKFIARLWAQRQVGMLLAEIRDKGEKKGLVDEVTQLATRFGIVTPYTSYLVVEPGTATPPPPRPRITRPDRPSIGRPTTGRDGSGFFGAFAPAEDAASAPAPASASRGAGGGAMRFRRAPAKKSKARELLKAESGKGAVDAAKEIGRLRESRVASADKVMTSETRVLGRVFRFVSGVWSDANAGAKAKTQTQTLSIRAYSDAFFSVLKWRPELKAALALGEEVRVSVGKGRVLVVSASAPKTVDAAKLKRFVRR